MKEEIFVIYDKDESYVRRLMKYIANNSVFQIEIQGFSDIDRLKKYLENKDADMMLLAESVFEDDPEIKISGKALILTEEAMEEDINGFSAVYKYQSSDNVLREVFKHYAEETSSFVKARKNSRVELIGVISPVGGAGKTSFALALGQVLAEKEKVLYLNLEDYSGFHHLVKGDKSMTIAELIFFLKGNRGSFPGKLAETVKRLGRLDYIPPALFPEDIRTTESEIWLRLFDEIMKSEYDKVIIDFGREEEWTKDVLENCSRVFLPVKKDRLSEAKLEHFQMVLHVNKEEALLSKLEVIRIPQSSEVADLERLSDSSVGRFAENIYFKGISYG
ncbi:MAG: hypothetical protein K6F39_02830 [Lachnospiraceae bacterium]|nr:hypothetical protein [Lachnospiraceae bacterium]